MKERVKLINMLNKLSNYNISFKRIEMKNEKTIIYIRKNCFSRIKFFIENEVVENNIEFKVNEE